MSRSKILIFVGVLGAIGLFLAIVVAPWQAPPPGSGAANTPGVTPPAISTLGNPIASIPGNAFLPPSQGAGTNTSLNGGGGNVSQEAPIYQGKPVTTIDQVATIVTDANQGQKILPGDTLPLPAVSDSEITIDAAGAATVADYLTYFNTHATDKTSFDGKKFEGVLKDANGVILLTPDLIDKAVADNGFSEIHNSLVVQKDFAAAEIAYLSSIKVMEGMAPFHKEAIGMEKLLITLIDKALAVESGTLTKNDLADFYQKFLATATMAHKDFVARSGALAVAPEENWLERVMSQLGFAPQARAQFGLNFGGRIGVPIPCTCNLGFWVFVGPPAPASLFVSYFFIASPMFHLWKSLRPGAWWLGLKLPIVVPCLQLPFCTPIGAGNTILTVGTSL